MMIISVFVNGHSPHITAQGQLVERLPDGRCIIDVGGNKVTGFQINPPSTPTPQIAAV